MIVFQKDLVVNSLSFKLLTFLLDIVENEKEDYPLRWLFELLLYNEGFVDLGEIRSSQHWAKRAYDNEGEIFSRRKYYTKLKKEELKQFIRMTGGTFGFIKFKIDNNKTIYTFSYLPLDNENDHSLKIVEISYQFDSNMTIE